MSSADPERVLLHYLITSKSVRAGWARSTRLKTRSWAVTSLLSFSRQTPLAGTFRPEDVERSGHPLKSYKAEMQVRNLCEEVALGSWNREHVAEYLDATFSPNDFPSQLTSLIHEKTEGHPLFAANLLQYLGER